MDDEEFFLSNTVQVTNAGVQPRTEKTENKRESAEIITMSEPSTSSSCFITNEPHKVETQLQAIMVDVRALLVEKKEAEKKAKELLLKYNWLLEKMNNVNEGHVIKETAVE